MRFLFNDLVTSWKIFRKEFQIAVISTINHSFLYAECHRKILGIISLLESLFGAFTLTYSIVAHHSGVGSRDSINEAKKVEPSIICL